MNLESNRDEGAVERSSGDSRRFYVRAGSVNAVRRALYRAPGGARVVGRFDRDTIECQHTMDGHSYRRHWPVIASRLEKAGLAIVAHAGFATRGQPGGAGLELKLLSRPPIENVDQGAAPDSGTDGSPHVSEISAGE